MLETITGYRLDWRSQPNQFHRPVTGSLNHLQSSAIAEEIPRLLEKGAIEEVPTLRQGFYSRLFLVPKKDQQMRPVINLRPLNNFLRHEHFKMEGIHIVKDLLRQGDWLTRIDLKDAYFAIPIHTQDRKFLRFLWQNRSFQFTCLPFGLSSAPRVFTKVLRPVIAFLRSKGVRCVTYIDDILFMHQDKAKLSEITATAVTLLEALGFLVNYTKSVLTPTQKLVFLGFVVDTLKRELGLPAEKLHKLVKDVRATLNLQSVSARHLAKLIGKMSATIQAVHPAPLNYRSIQRLKHAALRRGGYDKQIALNQESRKDLEWWTENLSRWNGRPLQESSPILTIETDASLTGWGAFCQGVMTGGCWSMTEKAHHINSLEMLAAFFAIKAFARSYQGISVLIRSDNQTVVAHINKMGGTKSPLITAQVKELWAWCLQRKISVKAQHLPGVENVMADYLSRHLRDRTDWILDPSVFSCLNNQFGPLQVDLFATRFSRQLLRFFSWRPDPEAEATDAFTQDWSSILGFAHPPWCLIPRVLRKVRSEEASLVLVTPLWPSQAWFPDLMEMLMDSPIELPQMAGVITPSPNCDCPVGETPPRLVAWKVSGKDSDLVEFQNKQLSSSWLHGEARPMPIMTQHGKPGKHGVLGKGYIPLRQMYATC